MTKELNPEHLHIAAFAKSAGRFAADVRLARFSRLIEETQGLGGENRVTYAAEGAVREDAAGVQEAWLRLAGQVTLPLVCQRCLGPVDVDVAFERDFRFVASEELAAVEDEESEEDVLVLCRDFNLLELLEDELLMAMPPAPTHDVCPVPVKFQAADSDFDVQSAQKPNPFAVLATLKKSGNP